MKPFHGVSWVLGLALTAVCGSTQCAQAADYFDEPRAGGVWAFDLWALNDPSFVSDPMDDVAHRISADNPDVAGLAPRIFWRTIEPEEGEYNWAPIDRLFEIADKYDKLVALRFIGGRNRKYGPDWIWNYVQIYVDQFTAWQQEGRTPRLGDPEFQRLWNGFLRKAGERYAANPRLQRVPMSSGLDQEMYYIKDMTAEDFAKLWPEGFEACLDNLLRSWRETIATYKEAFPNKAFVLDLSQPFTRTEGIDSTDAMTQIVQDAAEILGPQLYLQQDGLSERNEMADAVRAAGSKGNRGIMLNMADKHVIGFETLVAPGAEKDFPLSPPPNVFYHDLAKTSKVALSFPIRYIEFWTTALNDSANREIIHQTAVELQKRAGE